MTLPGPRLTYADYLLLPDDKRYELVEGELLVAPAPTSRHQLVCVNLALLLGNYIVQHNLGKLFVAPADVIFAEDTVLQPDLLFVARNRESIIDLDGGIHGAPDLIIEILSPSNPRHDQMTKRRLYKRHGVREYWIVDPVAREVEVLTDQGEEWERWLYVETDGTLPSATFPELNLSLAAIFKV